MKLKNKIVLLILTIIMIMPISKVFATCADISVQECPRYRTCTIKTDDEGNSKCVNNVNLSSKVSCGNITNIPKKIVELTSWIIKLIEIAVPIVLVIMGSLDLIKGITAQKEDEIKKGQQMFIKRLIVAASIFFVIAISKLLISVISDVTTKDTNGKTESNKIIECVDCFLGGPERCN